MTYVRHIFINVYVDNTF